MLSEYLSDPFKNKGPRSNPRPNKMVEARGVEGQDVCFEGERVEEKGRSDETEKLEASSTATPEPVKAAPAKKKTRRPRRRTGGGGGWSASAY